MNPLQDPFNFTGMADAIRSNALRRTIQGLFHLKDHLFNAVIFDGMHEAQQVLRNLRHDKDER